MVYSSRTASISPPVDPWLAVNFSLVFPGLGQLYSRHWLKGSSLMAIAIGLLLYATRSIFGAEGQTMHGFWAMGGFIVLYSFNILDAYRGTQPHYAARIAVPKGRQDPWYAVFLSQILPGLGHLYLQQALMGGVLLMMGIGTVWLANRWPVFAPLPPAIWALSSYHVYRTAPRRSRPQATAIALLILGIFLTRLVLSSTPNWVNQTFVQCIVPSDSMVPTLQIGDRLFVRRDRPYSPQTGDIVVFEPTDTLRSLLPPDATDILFVKRIIGLPGQTLHITNGQVFVNDQPLAEPYIQAPPTPDWGPAIVPPSHYFVLGDNRNTSSDSRIWGYVPREHILGNAYKIYWPPHRVRSLE
jgi:signal peptidase I